MTTWAFACLTDLGADPPLGTVDRRLERQQHDERTIESLSPQCLLISLRPGGPGRQAALLLPLSGVDGLKGRHAGFEQ
jgi:hypothetical protein